MLYIFIYLGIFGLWMLYEIIKAPSGYENAEGFFLTDTEKTDILRSSSPKDKNLSEKD
ncbi:MAG: hypothetical protein ACM34K_02080 [Bacillota bacterium]